MKERRIKVIHVITKMDVGGAQETALRAVASLDAERFGAILVSGGEIGSTGSLHEEATRLGVDLRIVPALVRRIAPLRDAVASVMLMALFLRERPDVVHTHSSKAGVLGRITARFAGVPLIVHSVHGWSFRSHMPPWLHGCAVLAEQTMARICDRIIVVSDRDRIEGLAYGVGRTSQYVLVRSGIDVERYAAAKQLRPATRAGLHIPDHVPVIGSVMRLARPKDPETFLRAAASVRTRYPEARFVIVGDGPRRSAVESLAEALGLADSVIFTGVRRDVPELLGALDIFVLASWSEGLPRVVTEAMASSVPVVASDVGGISEVVESGETGLLVPPGDVEELAGALLRLLSNEDWARRLATAGRARVDEFDQRTMDSAFHRLYLSTDTVHQRRGKAGVGGERPSVSCP